MLVYLAFFCGAAVVGVPVLIWLSWSGRLYTKVGTPSTSHNTGSPKCPRSACKNHQIMCDKCSRQGRSDHCETRPLRAGA